MTDTKPRAEHEGARTPLREFVENFCEGFEEAHIPYGSAPDPNFLERMYHAARVALNQAEGPGEAERLLRAPLAPNRLAEIERRVRKCDSPDATNIWFAYTKELLAALAGAQVPPATPATRDPHVLFISAVSGLLYDNPDAAGDISAIRIGDRTFHLEEPAAAPQPQEPDTWRHQFRDAIAEQSYLRWREKFLTTSSGGLGYDLGPWCDLKPETKDGWRKQADKFMPSIDALLDAVRKETIERCAPLFESDGECAWCGWAFNIEKHAYDCQGATLANLPEGEPFNDSYSTKRIRVGSVLRALATAPTGEEK